MAEAKAAPSAKQRICFIVGPIGKPDSPERTAADWLLHYVIRAVLEDAEFGFKVIRADEVAQPGLITDQIIALVMDADLVVADLTDHNANAFYELAIRHMVQKATIHMIRADQVPPFDIKDYRAIFYQTVRVQDVATAKDDLRKQVAAVLTEGYEVANPITRARGLQKLQGSSDSSEKLLASVIGKQEEQGALVNNVVELLATVFTRLDNIDRRRPRGVEVLLGSGGMREPTGLTGAGALSHIFAADPERSPESAPANRLLYSTLPKKPDEPA